MEAAALQSLMLIKSSNYYRAIGFTKYWECVIKIAVSNINMDGFWRFCIYKAINVSAVIKDNILSMHSRQRGKEMTMWKI